MVGKKLGTDYFPTFLTSGKKESAGHFSAAVHHHFGNFGASQTKEGKASMDDVMFTELIDKFGDMVPANEIQILLVDGHDSHERHSVLSMARKKNIIFVRFPSHCTHLMQPLDLSYFKPFKSAFLGEMEAIVAGYGDASKTITAKDFVKAVKVATEQMAVRGVITEGFRAMGLTASASGDSVDIDSNAVPEYKLLGSDRAHISDDRALAFTVGEEVVEFSKLTVREKAVVEAHRMYLVQEGMTLPKARSFKYQNPTADELTTSPMVARAVERDLSRDERRHKKSRSSLAKAAAACGAAVMIEGEENGVLLPKPQEGFVDVGIDDVMNLIVISSINVVSLEKLIALTDDADYEFWVTLRNVWYKVKELEVIKKYKKQDEKVAVVSCKLGGNAEKKLGRNDINVEGYGGSWVIFKKRE